MTNKPSTLYRYERLSMQSLTNLKAQAVYFGSPKGFNDPYDCALSGSIVSPTMEDLERIRAAYGKKHPERWPSGRGFDGMTDEQLREDITRQGRDGVRSAVNRFLDERGVACFTACNDNLLMWAHYGDRYRGYCLAFDSSREPLVKARPVVYSAQMPQFSASSLLVDEDFDGVVEKLFYTKSISWEYEREWRTLHHQAGTLYTYEPEALQGIYFGPSVDTRSIEIVCLILQGQNPGVRLYKGKRSETHFRIEFEEFKYIPYVHRGGGAGGGA